MDLTDFEFPILQRFFCIVETRTGMPVQPLEAERKQHDDLAAKPLPKGMVLGPDGKPYVHRSRL